MLKIDAEKENINRCSMLMAKLQRVDEESKRYKKECEKQKLELALQIRKNKQLTVQIKQLQNCGKNFQSEIHDISQSNKKENKPKEIDHNNDESYEVENILDQKIKQKQQYFKIR